MEGTGLDGTIWVCRGAPGDKSDGCAATEGGREERGRLVGRKREKEESVEGRGQRGGEFADALQVMHDNKTGQDTDS